MPAIYGSTEIQLLPALRGTVQQAFGADPRVRYLDLLGRQRLAEAGRVCREHPSRRERISAGYPPLYLALLRRKEPVVHAECIVARARGRSRDLV